MVESTRGKNIQAMDCWAIQVVEMYHIDFSDILIYSQEMWLGVRMCRSVADTRPQKPRHYFAPLNSEDGSCLFAILN